MRTSNRSNRQVNSPLSRAFELRGEYLASQLAKSMPLIDASQGVPNYAPPAALLRELEQRAQETKSYTYTDRRGIAALRHAISSDCRKNYSFTIDPDEVLVTAGCNEAFCAAAFAVLDIGDQVIVPRPYYFNHPMWLDLIGAEVIWADGRTSGIPDLEEVKSLVNEKVRALVLVSPNNPTGAEIEAQSLHEICNFLKEREIFVILDETYRLFAKSKTKPLAGSSFADYPNVIRLLSFSKEFAVPGMRMGAVAAERSLTEEILKTHDCISICAPHIGQLAVLAAMNGSRAWQEEKSSDVLEKGLLLDKILASVGNGFELSSCGGFFGWMRHPFRELKYWEVVEKFLAETGVLVLPGTLFGDGQDEHVRIGFANLTHREIQEVGKRFKGLRGT